MSRYPIKVFQVREIREAREYAAKGGQALHLHQMLRPGAPACFVKEVNAGRNIAHLFDQDRRRLFKSAYRFGVKVVVVEKRDHPNQHVDLCGGPLRRAEREAARMETEAQGEFSL